MPAQASLGFGSNCRDLCRRLARPPAGAVALPAKQLQTHVARVRSRRSEVVFERKNTRVMLPLQVLTVVLPAMSSKKEERDEKRAAAAASIFPGWIVQSLGSWTPKQNKPELKHLRAEALTRNINMKDLRTAQDYMTWLSRNGPTESTAASHKTMLLQVDPEGMVDPETLTTFKCARKSRTGVWG